ncbi:MAG: hypothetical protein LLG20_13705 [Acidobacteriales bacterium]|nr:hypothetical protein [Terriglobales bacterium]
MSAPEEQFVKSSAVLISSGKKVKVYRSVEEVPGRLRKRLIESTNSINSGTILIANRAGRDRILNALRSLPKGAHRQLLAALRDQPEHSERFTWPWRRVLALVLSLSTAVALWFLLAIWRRG